ncbi:VWA domain-containing protein, partial [Myxococcota bacterium]|nr:VWA domain-containing protein [Myxococcota bacterium]
VLGVALNLVWRRRAQREPGLVFSSTRLVDGLPRTFWARAWWLPDALRVLALVCFVVALARPQKVGEAEAEDAEGIDIVLTLDTSCSMRAADFQPNDRMFVAKKSISEFIKQRTNDRIGLVVFAGEAASWVPLTLDYTLLAQLLDEVDTNMLPDGTAIGSAIGTALNRLRESDAASRVIVLLTDGDNNRGSISPKQAAALAKELGVKIYTILIGRGGAVPVPAGKDLFGRVVYEERVIPTNPALLEELASTTGGAAYKATDKAELDRQLGNVLDSLDKTRLEAQAFSAPKDELFPWLVGLGLVLLALELALGSTRLWRYP